MSWTNILKYKSTKVVVVQDWRLGALYYSILIGISAYIIYTMVTTGSYLDKGPPVGGSVRMSAKFLSNIIDTPSYCKPGPFNPNGCVFWSPDQIIFPYMGETNSLFVTTRVSIYQSNPSNNTLCSIYAPDSPSCVTPTIDTLKDTKKVYYVANVENLSFRVDMNVRTQSSFAFGAQSFKTFSAQNMTGAIVSACPSGNSVKLFDKDFRQKGLKTYGTALDIFTMQEILDASICAAKFDLGAAATADGSKAGEDLRSSGAIVSLPISYTNRASDANALKYSYLPALIDGSEFKITQTLYNADGTITYLDRHGIKFAIEQTGSIGIFNPIALVLNIVAAFALFKIATIVVDSIMLHFLPDKEFYSEAKYQHTDVIS